MITIFILNNFLLDDRVTFPYLLFKLVVSIYFLASYVVSHISWAVYPEGYGIKQNDATVWPYYWIYLTNWSWTLICLSFWIDTCLVILRYRKEKKHLHHADGESKITSGLKGIYLNPIHPIDVPSIDFKIKWNKLFF